MTSFETLTKEIGIKIETDEHGLYTGMTKALANIVTESIFDFDDFDDEEIFFIAKKRFYKTFPYMMKKEK